MVENMTYVVVVVQGGCVRSVMSNAENVHVKVMDFDDADGDPKRLSKLERLQLRFEKLLSYVW